ncbi:MAG: hypothetical protein KQH57_11245 [Actinomycetales bacterium]|nr:hypothetical protein [Actinomycetales bacterium]
MRQHLEGPSGSSAARTEQFLPPGEFVEQGRGPGLGGALGVEVVRVGFEPARDLTADPDDLGRDRPGPKFARRRSAIKLAPQGEGARDAHLGGGDGRLQRGSRPGAELRLGEAELLLPVLERVVDRDE